MKRLAVQDLNHILEYGRDAWPALSGARIFMTGGTGFVGKWLVESLLWANDELNLHASVVLLTRNPERFRSESPHLASHPAVSLLAGDARTFEFPDGDFPFLIHAATERSFEPNSEQPMAAFDRDLEGTRRVLDFARSRQTRRFLFTSSGAVYGKQPSSMTHMAEDYAGAPSPVDTGAAYGQAKRASEFACCMYARQYGFAALIARLFAFVGPHLPLEANFAVGNFIRDALQGGPVRVKGDGTPYRSYLYAADLAVWLWTILVRGDSARPYNVGSGEALSIMDLAHVVADANDRRLGVEIAKAAVPGAPPERYVPGVERAQSELGLRADIPVAGGIRRTIEWQCSLE